MVTVIASPAIGVVVDAVARYVMGTSIHTVFKGWLFILVDHQGSMSLGTIDMENL